jgi:archaeal type IV pilus assembly protein PilA
MNETIAKREEPGTREPVVMNNRLSGRGTQRSISAGRQAFIPSGYPRSIDVPGCREWGARTSRKSGADGGVSEVVGEMLMVGLVIILISVFGTVLGNSLPTAHDPSVTVMLTNDTGHVILWHKGGDWIKADEITLIIGNDRDTRKKYSLKDTAFHLVPKKGVFDLGSNITLDTAADFPAGLPAGETVILVTPRSQVFSGKVRI